MDKDQFVTIADKLDKILRLLTIPAVREKEKEQDKIEFLDSLGFKSSEIDRLLGKNPGYSSVVLSQIKKRKQSKLPIDPEASPPSQTGGAVV